MKITNESVARQLIEESRYMELQMKDIAKNILSGNEDGRTKMSDSLQNEISQTLLGIHGRLLALKNEMSSNHHRLAANTTITRRLVASALRTITRFTRQFHPRHG
jgi:signal transduction histidine kinase